MGNYPHDVVTTIDGNINNNKRQGYGCVHVTPYGSGQYLRPKIEKVFAHVATSGLYHDRFIFAAADY